MGLWLAVFVHRLALQGFEFSWNVHRVEGKVGQGGEICLWADCSSPRFWVPMVLDPIFWDFLILAVAATCQHQADGAGHSPSPLSVFHPFVKIYFCLSLNFLLFPLCSPSSLALCSSSSPVSWHCTELRSCPNTFFLWNYSIPYSQFLKNRQKPFIPEKQTKSRQPKTY